MLRNWVAKPELDYKKSKFRNYTLKLLNIALYLLILPIFVKKMFANEEKLSFLKYCFFRKSSPQFHDTYYN